MFFEKLRKKEKEVSLSAEYNTEPDHKVLELLAARRMAERITVAEAARQYKQTLEHEAREVDLTGEIHRCLQDIERLVESITEKQKEFIQHKVGFRALQSHKKASLLEQVEDQGGAKHLAYVDPGMMQERLSLLASEYGAGIPNLVSANMSEQGSVVTAYGVEQFARLEAINALDHEYIDGEVFHVSWSLQYVSDHEYRVVETYDYHNEGRQQTLFTIYKDFIDSKIKVSSETEEDMYFILGIMLQTQSGLERQLAAVSQRPRTLRKWWLENRAFDYRHYRQQIDAFREDGVDEP